MKRFKIRQQPSLRALENCERKAWFKTEAEAKEAADARMLDNMTVELEVYQCTICQNWHLTRKSGII